MRPGGTGGLQAGAADLGPLYHGGTLSPANLQSHPVLDPQGSMACGGEECVELRLLPLMIPGVIKADPATEVVPFSLRSCGARKWDQSAGAKPGSMEPDPAASDLWPES